MEVDTGEVSASGANGKDGKQEEQNTVASDEQIEEVFDILPIVSELLENITTSNVAEKVDDTPKRIDVTQKIAALKAKFNAAEEFLQNISGGECGSRRLRHAPAQPSYLSSIYCVDDETSHQGI